MKERMLLLSFYLAYEAWVDAGAQPDGVFSRYSGLCGNLYDWCNAQKLEPYRCILLDMMHADFITAGLDEELPFNRPVSRSERSYTTEQRYCACHKNKARLEWVRRQVAAFENVVEERDALREEHMNGGSGTRHAADIYFQLRQEHNLTREESLVEYVDTLKAENVAIKQAAKEVIAYWAAAEKGQMEYAMDQSIPALRDACGFTEEINTLLSEDSGKEKAYGRKA